MRKLNLRFLAVLLGSCVVLGGCVHLLHGFQVRRNAGAFLREAERALGSDDLRQAAQQFRRYLQFMPQDAQAQLDYAMVMADLVDAGRAGARGAYEALERALRSNPDRMEVRRRIVPLTIGLGRFSDAQEHLVDYLLPAEPEDPELLMMLATCQQQTGREPEAAKTLERAVALDPTDVQAHLRLALLLRERLDQPQAADEQIGAMIRANPDSCDAHVAQGNYLLTTRRPNDTERLAEALQSAERALDLAPEHPGGLLLAAQCSLEQDDFETARGYAEQVVDLYPTSREAYSTLAAIELGEGDRERAIEWMRAGLEHAPNDQDLLWNLANLLLDAGQLEGAETVMGQLRAAEQPGALVRYLEARAAFVQGQWLTASLTFEQIRPELTEWPDVLKQLDFYLGSCYQQLGNADQQLAAYRRAVAVDPFWIPARAGVASALRATGRIDEALAQLREIMRLSDAPAAGLVDLIQLEIVRNLRRNRAERDWRETARLLQAAQERLPEDPRLPILQAEVLVSEERLAEAEELLQQAQEADPEAIELRITRAALAQRQRDWERAEQLLAGIEADLGDSARLRLARSQLLLQRDGPEAGDGLRELLEGSDAFPPESRSRLLGGLAGAMLQVGDFEQARALCLELAELEPNDLQIRLLLFDLALRAVDDAGLDGVLAEIQAIEGRGPFWHYGRALQLVLQAGGWGDARAAVADPTVEAEADLPEVDRGKLRSAQRHLAEARGLRPAWSRVPLLAAEVYDALGNQDQAIDHYLQAVQLGERNPRAIRRAVQMLTDRQRYAEADRILRRVEEQQLPFSSDLGRVAAEISLRLDDFDRALELARAAIDSESVNFRDHIWLGQVLSILGQREGGRSAGGVAMYDEAESEFRQAIELSEDRPEPWVALIQFLARTGQRDKAEQTVAQAEEQITGEQAPLALALCYEAIADVERAEQYYRQAVEGSPEDPNALRQLAEFYLRTNRPAEAEPRLQELVGGSLAVGSTDLNWARRSLAVLLGARGSYASQVEALELVDRNLAVPNPTLEDQRAKAILLAGHPQRRQRERAIEMLEQILQQQRVPAPSDRFTLARLYLRQGPRGWSQASRQFRTLLSSSNNPAHVEAYVEALLARNETGEAELWLRRLHQLAPISLSATILQARADVQRSRYDRAIEQLTDFLERFTATDEERALHAGPVATTVEQLAGQASERGAERLLAAAETLYELHAESGADGQMVRAAFLARHDRLDEALDLAEEAAGECRPDILVGTIVDLLGRGTAPEAQRQRAEQLMRAGLERHERPTGLLLALADYYAYVRRNREAKELYREVLDRRPDQVLALNNLGVLMALEGVQLDSALAMIQRAIEVAGPSPSLIDSRATIRLARGEYQEALADMTAVLAEAPTAAAHFRHAQVLHRLGLRSAATEAWEEALRMDLTPESLHPLERSAYEALRRELGGDVRQASR